MDLGLKGKRALVTGGTRGIGRAIVEALAGEGADVAFCARDAAAVEATVVEVGATGVRASGRALDVTDGDRLQTWIDDVAGQFGGIDIVVANVGSGTAPTGWQLSREDWQAALNGNLLGGMVLATEALARMFEEQRGSLVMVSSIAGSEAIGAPAPYSAAKAALQSAVKSLSRLAGPHGVRVNAVAPGNVLFPGGSWERKLAERREFFKDYIQREVPLKRFGAPREIADTAGFLASERASFVTGACWVVDGGQTRSFC